MQDTCRDRARRNAQCAPDLGLRLTVGNHLEHPRLGRRQTPPTMASQASISLRDLLRRRGPVVIDSNLIDGNSGTEPLAALGAAFGCANELRRSTKSSRS